MMCWLLLGQLEWLWPLEALALSKATVDAVKVFETRTPGLADVLSLEDRRFGLPSEAWPFSPISVVQWLSVDP